MCKYKLCNSYYCKSRNKYLMNIKENILIFFVLVKNNNYQI